MTNIPSPDEIFTNKYHAMYFIKNVVTAPNISIGDYTYYDDAIDPEGFEKGDVLFSYPEFSDHLIIGKFCMIAQGAKFIICPANHCITSVTAYPFNVFGGARLNDIVSGIIVTLLAPDEFCGPLRPNAAN